jgi:hypothetical protein
MNFKLKKTLHHNTKHAPTSNHSLLNFLISYFLTEGYVQHFSVYCTTATNELILTQVMVTSNQVRNAQNLSTIKHACTL